MHRIFNCGLSLLLILLLSPMLFIIALAIKLTSNGPIFFSQSRIGKNGKCFPMYKFRSMKVNNIPPISLGAVKHQHPLVTPIGYIIRRFKLDELPQLFNILRGDMNFIGPRPCLPERLLTMTVAEKRRFTVLPGLAGWAEVNGNVELTWQEQLLLDLWYVDQRNVSLDIMILFKIFYVVLFGSQKNPSALKEAATIEGKSV
jgi:undecaprenyl phosphate N,N'-diacetylbacillosamine 1-phosphate transferase